MQNDTNSVDEQTLESLGFSSLGAGVAKIIGSLDTRPDRDLILAGIRDAQQSGQRLGDRDDAACSRCGDVGWLRSNVMPGEPGFGQLVECSCAIGQAAVQRRQERIWAEAKIPPKMAEYTLDTLAKRSPVLADELRIWQGTGRWLVMRGPKGTCKTGAAVALLLEHMRAGGRGLYLKPAKFLERIRETYGADEDTSAREVLRSVAETPFLVLDDIGTEVLTKWGQEKLFTMIDDRSELHTPAAPLITVVTTNLELKQLAKHLDDEGRAWDRIRDCAKVIETSGASQRGLDL